MGQVNCVRVAGSTAITAFDVNPKSADEVRRIARKFNVGVGRVLIAVLESAIAADAVEECVAKVGVARKGRPFAKRRVAKISPQPREIEEPRLQDKVCRSIHGGRIPYFGGCIYPECKCKL